MITFTLPLPTSINATYKTGNGRYYKSSEARGWERDALWKLAEQRLNHTMPIVDGDIYVSIEMFVIRDRDIDSGLKILLDFMQDRFYTNDSQIKHLNVKKYKDNNPRVEVQIEQL